MKYTKQRFFQIKIHLNHSTLLHSEWKTHRVFAECLHICSETFTFGPGYQYLIVRDNEAHSECLKKALGNM